MDWRGELPPILPPSISGALCVGTGSKQYHMMVSCLLKGLIKLNAHYCSYILEHKKRSVYGLSVVARCLISR